MKKKDELSYKKFWNERYKKTVFAYGRQPNLFFKKHIDVLEPKTLLMPGDGEGRNGVYAATLGWDVTATDLSVEGKNKALKLAQENKVSINYVVGDLIELEFTEASFDAIGLIYAHFSASKIEKLHKKLSTYLKTGGTLILEAYSKKHIDYRNANPKVGGPTTVDMLFSVEMIKNHFSNFEPIHLLEKEVNLNEGNCHNGLGSVVQFVGIKK